AARKHYRENVPRVEAEQGRVTAHDILDYIDESPEILRDPELGKAIEAYRNIKRDQPSSDVPKYAPIVQSRRGKKREDGTEVDARGVEERVKAKQRSYDDAKKRLERAHAKAKQRVDRLRGEVHGRE